MDISELSVRRPVLMVMVYVLICVVAAVFIPKLGIALTPNVEFPMLAVMTTYSNVGPEEIDTNVTKVITNQLSRIQGIKNITSTSSAGRSQIQLEFAYNSDLDKASRDVESAVSRISGWLPDGCGTPTVIKFDASMMPIMRLSVEGDLPINELKTLAEDKVSPFLERLEDVANVDVQGGAAKEIRVDVSVNRLEAYGLTLSSIAQALAARNYQLSSGEITQNGIDYEIITSEYYQNLDEIRQTIISTAQGSIIRVDDVATVYEQYATRGREVYINGTPGLYISISNESGSNASMVSKRVHAVLDEINKAMPTGVKVEIVSDNTTMIDSTMNQVYESVIEGIVLAMLVIFFFLRNLKSTFIIGLSIPVCFLITLMSMGIMGLTVNLMTMSGLILGMGMVVDSSIVILENIYNRRIRGEKPAVAAILGSKNMVNAIMASTLTTICVFLPMLIYQSELEIIGMMMKELIITVVISLVSSLFVAVTLVPALCGSILKLNNPNEKRKYKTKLFKYLSTKQFYNNTIKVVSAPLRLASNIIEKFITGMERVYVKTLRFCLRNRFIIITMVVIIMVYCGILFKSFGMNFSPPSNADDQVNVTITMPVGTNKKYVLEKLFEFQEIVKKECGGAYRSIILNAGGSNSGSIQINLLPLNQQTMNPTQIKAALTPYLKNWADTTVSFSSGRGMGGGAKAIDVKLISNDTNASRKTAEQIKELFDNNPKLVDAATDFENGSPRFQLVIDTEAAAASGVSVSSIATEIRSAINGRNATTFYDNGQEYDIVVAVPPDEIVNTSDIGSLFINTASGRMTLDNFVKYKETNAPQRIQRENSDRVNHVTCGLAEGITVTEGQAMVEKLIAENIVLPESVELSYGGDAADISSMGSTFIIVIVLALFLVFAVMAAQFESLIDPFIVFISIPLLVIGVVAVYKFTGQSFSMYSVVGIVCLIGIVVNNGIVLVDYTNQLVGKKIPVFDACLESARSRLRPILMSTLTTVLSMVPMAFFPGEGAEMMQPVCITIVGGLLSGAFMTLYVSPIMYTVFNKRREKRFDDPDSLMNQLASLDDGSYIADIVPVGEQKLGEENAEPAEENAGNTENSRNYAKDEVPNAEENAVIAEKEKEEPAAPDFFDNLAKSEAVLQTEDFAKTESPVKTAADFTQPEDFASFRRPAPRPAQTASFAENTAAFETEEPKPAAAKPAEKPDAGAEKFAFNFQPEKPAVQNPNAGTGEKPARKNYGDIMDF